MTARELVDALATVVDAYEAKIRTLEAKLAAVQAKWDPDGPTIEEALPDGDDGSSMTFQPKATP